MPFLICLEIILLSRPGWMFVVYPIGKRERHPRGCLLHMILFREDVLIYTLNYKINCISFLNENPLEFKNRRLIPSILS